MPNSPFNRKTLLSQAIARALEARNTNEALTLRMGSGGAGIQRMGSGGAGIQRMGSGGAGISTGILRMGAGGAGLPQQMQ